MSKLTGDLITDESTAVCVKRKDGSVQELSALASGENRPSLTARHTQKVKSSPGVVREVESRILGQICCMFGSVPCHCFCKTCPSIKESTSTRLMYFLMFAFTIALAVVGLNSQLPSILAREFPIFNATCLFYRANTGGPGCDGLFGNFEIVYKMCMGQLSMHLILLPLTASASNSGSCFSALHNGFWFWKWLWIISVNGAAIFFLHGDHFTWPAIVLRYMGIVGGSLFILVNMFFICQVTMDFNNDLLKKADDKCKWHLVIWVITFIALGVCAAISYVLIKFYSACTENRVIAFVNIAACGLLLVLTIISGVGRGSKNADLMQGSIIISYVLYQTWSAIHNRPTGDFNVDVLSKAIEQSQDEVTMATLATTVFNNLRRMSNMSTVTGNGTQVGASAPSCMADFGIDVTQTRVTSAKLQHAGLAYYIFTALYKSVYHTSKQAKTANKYGPSSSMNIDRSSKSIHKCKSRVDIEVAMREQSGCCYSCKPLATGGQEIVYNEQRETVYNYCYLHFQFTCSVLFIMMTLTHWFDPGTKIELAEWTPSWAAFWVEIITAWFFILVYLFNLLLPVHCQSSPFFHTVAIHIPIPEETRRASLAKQEELRRQYLDVEGKPITDIENYEGILYQRGADGNLMPKRQINKIELSVQSLPNAGQRLNVPDSRRHLRSNEFVTKQVHPSTITNSLAQMAENIRRKSLKWIDGISQRQLRKQASKKSQKMKKNREPNRFDDSKESEEYVNVKSTHDNQRHKDKNGGTLNVPISSMSQHSREYYYPPFLADHSGSFLGNDSQHLAARYVGMHPTEAFVSAVDFENMETPYESHNRIRENQENSAYSTDKPKHDLPTLHRPVSLEGDPISSYEDLRKEARPLPTPPHKNLSNLRRVRSSMSYSYNERKNGQTGTLPTLLTDTNWRTRRAKDERGHLPTDTDFDQSYQDLASKMAYRYPHPGAPKGREGGIGGTWRHTKEAIGYGPGRLMWIDGTVSHYDVWAVNSEKPWSGRKTSSGSDKPDNAVYGMPRQVLRVVPHPMIPVVDRSNRWYSANMPQPLGSTTAHQPKSTPDSKYKGFYSMAQAYS